MKGLVLVIIVLRYYGAQANADGSGYTVVFRSLLWLTINGVALSCARGISLRSATPRRSALAVLRR